MRYPWKSGGPQVSVLFLFFTLMRSIAFKKNYNWCLWMEVFWAVCGLFWVLLKKGWSFSGESLCLQNEYPEQKEAGFLYSNLAHQRCQAGLLTGWKWACYRRGSWEPCERLEWTGLKTSTPSFLPSQWGCKKGSEEQTIFPRRWTLVPLATCFFLRNFWFLDM